MIMKASNLFEINFFDSVKCIPLYYISKNVVKINTNNPERFCSRRNHLADIK